MPRVHGIIERRDWCYYDTELITPGRSVYMFGNANIGDWRKTNLQISGTVSYLGPFGLTSIGVRLLGRTLEEEQLLLDHLSVLFMMGDEPQLELVGSHTSMLRQVYTKDEVERMGLLLDETEEFCPGGLSQHEFHGGTKCCLCGQRKKEEPARPLQRLGFHLSKPIIVPVRQNIGVKIQVSGFLKEDLIARVHLFGVGSYER